MLNFKDLKIKYKLGFGFLTIIIFLLLISGVGLFNLNKIVQTAPLVDAAMEMRLTLRECQLFLMEMLASPNGDELEDIWSEHQASKETFLLFSKGITEGVDTDEGYIYPSKNLETLKAVTTSTNDYTNQLMPEMDSVYEFMKKQHRQGEINKEEIADYQLSVDEKIDGLASNIMVRLIKIEELSKEEIDKAQNNAISFISIFTIIALIISIMLSYFITLMIVGPTKKLEKVSEMLSNGDLRVKFDQSLINQKDEIGSLAKGFSIMVDNLKQLIESIMSNAEKSASTAEELSASSEEVNASTEQVSSTVQQIAKGGQALSLNANQSKDSAEKLILSVQAVAESSQESTKSANEAKDEALRGSESAKTAGEKMRLIKDAVGSSALQVQELGAKTEEINKIIEVINSISEQTNLLALNAAIEAARAGEAGKGFAVVADEVRKLAEESQKATKQIETMVSDIISATKTSVESMGKGTLEVEQGSKVVGEALSSLELIGQKITNVASQVEMISAATQEQLAASEQVKGMVQEVSSVAEESAASTEEVSASVQEITSSVQQVASSAQSLAKNAEELKQLVNQFKL